jgi:predicted DNA-binding WGR domain protein
MKRTFEFLDGKSAKFWEIELQGASHTVRYGKLGTKGQSSTKSFATADKAKQDADKQIASKVKKGYVEVVPQAAAAVAVDEAALAAELAKLDADPSPEARQVFGDWLQSVGHPWGQLISLDHVGKHDERDALLANTPALLGELSRRTKQVSFTWQQGFIDEATIISGGNAKILQQCLQALFEQPVARYVRRLVLDGAPETLATTRDWGYGQEENIAAPFGPQVIRELGKAPKTLTELAFGKAPPRGASAYVRAPNLANVAELLPELEVIELQAAGESFTRVRFAKLRRLELRFANASDGDLQAVHSSELPRLEQLSIWLGGTTHCTLDDVFSPDEIDDWDAYEEQGSPLRYPERYDSSTLDELEVYSASGTVSANALAEFCNADWPASLTRLGMQSAMLDDDQLAALLGSNIIARLTHLDLSGGAIGDKQVGVITRHAKQLAHLERLDLRRNQLGAKQVAQIVKALPNADCSEQRKGQMAPEFLFRYVATME